jgi:hypothetical protein
MGMPWPVALDWPKSINTATFFFISIAFLSYVQFIKLWGLRQEGYGIFPACGENKGAPRKFWLILAAVYGTIMMNDFPEKGVPE